MREDLKALVDQLDTAAVARLIVMSHDCVMPRSPEVTAAASDSDVLQLQRHVDELLAKVAQLEHENLAMREETRKHSCARCGFCFEPPSAEAHLSSLSPVKTDEDSLDNSGSFFAYPRLWSSNSWMGPEDPWAHTPTNAPTRPPLAVFLIVNADSLDRPVTLVAKLVAGTPTSSPQRHAPPASADRSPHLALRARAAIRLARECMARSPRPVGSPAIVSKPWAVEMGRDSPAPFPYHADVKASTSF
jgi:hypothetical protein